MSRNGSYRIFQCSLQVLWKNKVEAKSRGSTSTSDSLKANLHPSPSLPIYPRKTNKLEMTIPLMKCDKPKAFYFNFSKLVSVSGLSPRHMMLRTPTLHFLVNLCLHICEIQCWCDIWHIVSKQNYNIQWQFYNRKILQSITRIIKVVCKLKYWQSREMRLIFTFFIVRHVSDTIALPYNRIGVN